MKMKNDSEKQQQKGASVQCAPLNKRVTLSLTN